MNGHPSTPLAGLAKPARILASGARIDKCRRWWHAGGRTIGFRLQVQPPASAPVVAMPLGMDFWYTIHGMCRGRKDMSAAGLRIAGESGAIRAAGGIHAAWRDSKQLQAAGTTLQHFMSFRSFMVKYAAFKGEVQNGSRTPCGDADAACSPSRLGAAKREHGSRTPYAELRVLRELRGKILRRHGRRDGDPPTDRCASASICG
jgi:hypothetical protein